MVSVREKQRKKNTAHRYAPLCYPDALKNNLEFEWRDIKATKVGRDGHILSPTSSEVHLSLRFVLVRAGLHLQRLPKLNCWRTGEMKKWSNFISSPNVWGKCFKEITAARRQFVLNMIFGYYIYLIKEIKPNQNSFVMKPFHQFHLHCAPRFKPTKWIQSIRCVPVPHNLLTAVCWDHCTTF